MLKTKRMKNSQESKKNEKFAQTEEGGENNEKFDPEKEDNKLITGQGMVIGMCIGMCIGMAFGSLFDNTSMGMCMGICFGMLLGIAYDHTNKKKK